MAQYLVIRKWKDFQHYKDRSPPWIKLHRELLTSRTWVGMNDASRSLAIALMLLAAATDNRIPADKEYLRRVAYLNSDPDWSPLVKVEFIDLIDESGVVLALASRSLAKRTERTSETEQSRAETDLLAAAPPARRVSRETDPEWFLDFKLAYPDRAGDQKWRGALIQSRKRLAEGHTEAEMIAGAKRYAAYCEAIGKVGTEYVKQACTFLGPEKPFLLSWTPPVGKAQDSRPLLREDAFDVARRARGET